MKKTKSMEQIYRISYYGASEIPYFESRYYAKRFLNEIVPPYSREGAVIKQTPQGFVILVLRPIYQYEFIQEEG